MLDAGSLRALQVGQGSWLDLVFTPRLGLMPAVVLPQDAALPGEEALAAAAPRPLPIDAVRTRPGRNSIAPARVEATLERLARGGRPASWQEAAEALAQRRVEQELARLGLR